MRAYWMSGQASAGVELDSSRYELFRNRIESEDIAELSAKALTFDGRATLPVLFEVSFELIRVREFGHCPSRLSSIFLWPTADLAIKYHAGASCASVFEVEIAEQRKLFQGDFDLVHYCPRQIRLHSFFEAARKYWGRSNSSPKRQEILLDGRICVVRKVR